MTVRELIEELSKLNQDYEVFLGREVGYDYDSDIYERDFSEILDIDVDNNEVMLVSEYRHKCYGRRSYPGKDNRFKETK